MTYKLEYPYTEEEKLDFIVQYNHNQGLRIETVDNFIEEQVKTQAVVDEETGEIIKEAETELVKENYPTYYALEVYEKLVDGEVIDNTEEYEQEQIKLKEAQFNKDFFNTSLGYVRRKVNMATGETKDFLSDLLPIISMGVNMGQEVTIIAYSKPDFTLDVIDWEKLQTPVVATPEFIQECFLQLSNDFIGN